MFRNQLVYIKKQKEALISSDLVITSHNPINLTNKVLDSEITFQNLSDPIILIIFSNLNFIERIKAAEVSPHFKLLSQDLQSWQELYKEIDDETVIKTYNQAINNICNIYKNAINLGILPPLDSPSEITFEKAEQLKKQMDKNISIITVWNTIIKTLPHASTDNPDTAELMKKNSEEVEFAFDNWLQENHNEINIKTLILDYKSLTYFPKALTNLTQLEVITLSGNKLKFTRFNWRFS